VVLASDPLSGFCFISRLGVDMVVASVLERLLVVGFLVMMILNWAFLVHSSVAKRSVSTRTLVFKVLVPGTHVSIGIHWFIVFIISSVRVVTFLSLHFY
jgi:hypothetical protein